MLKVMPRDLPPRKPLNPKFTAKIKGKDEEITGYYCMYFFENEKEFLPAIQVVKTYPKKMIRNIEEHFKIEPETLRPAEWEEI